MQSAWGYRARSSTRRARHDPPYFYCFVFSSIFLSSAVLPFPLLLNAFSSTGIKFFFSSSFVFLFAVTPSCSVLFCSFLNESNQWINKGGEINSSFLALSFLLPQILMVVKVRQSRRGERDGPGLTQIQCVRTPRLNWSLNISACVLSHRHVWWGNIVEG